MSRLFAGAALALLLACGDVGTNPTDPNEGIGKVGEWVESGFRIRTYSMVKSSGYTAGVPAPLLLLFHGAGGTGGGLRLLTGLYGAQDAADSGGFVLVYPDGVGNSWAAQCNCTVADWAGDVDDVRFVQTLLRQLVDSLSIDTTRIYVAGYSQGALLAQLLACRLADRLAGAGSVAATMAKQVANRCTPARAVPFIFFQGTADSIFPWNGDSRFLTAAGTVSKWASLDGCTGPPTLGAMPDTANDGTTVATEIHASCAGGAEVMFYAVTGGGHTWPGATGSFPAFTGPVSRDISANRLLVEFFTRH